MSQSPIALSSGQDCTCTSGTLSCKKNFVCWFAAGRAAGPSTPVKLGQGAQGSRSEGQQHWWPRQAVEEVNKKVGRLADNCGLLLPLACATTSTAAAPPTCYPGEQLRPQLPGGSQPLTHLPLSPFDAVTSQVGLPSPVWPTPILLAVYSHSAALQRHYMLKCVQTIQPMHAPCCKCLLHFTTLMVAS